MAVRHQIQCVTKSDRFNPHERITHVGGRLSNGTPWEITQEKAIEGIKDGSWDFYVSRAGYTVDVIVAVSRYGNEYLKTKSDGEQPDNLLSLAECPV